MTRHQIPGLHSEAAATVDNAQTIHASSRLCQGNAEYLVFAAPHYQRHAVFAQSFCSFPLAKTAQNALYLVGLTVPYRLTSPLRNGDRRDRPQATFIRPSIVAEEIK